MNWKLYLNFAYALLQLGKPAKALRMFWAARDDPQGYEALSPFESSLLALEEMTQTHVGQLLEMGRRLTAEPFYIPQIWKNQQGKWMEVDGVHTIWHACSTAENFLDRGAREAFDPNDSKSFARLILYLMEIGTSDFRLPEVTECCMCHRRCEVPRCLVNDSSDFVCSACGTEQTMVAVQLTPDLEAAFQLSSPLGGPVVYMAVPRQHPELDALLLWGGVTIHKAVEFYAGLGGAPWWPFYAKLPL